MDLTLITGLICAAFASALTIYSALRWKGERYLCDTCQYNQEGACLKRERPKAVVCMSYTAGDHSSVQLAVSVEKD